MIVSDQQLTAQEKVIERLARTKGVLYSNSVAGLINLGECLPSVEEEMC